MDQLKELAQLVFTDLNQARGLIAAVPSVVRHQHDGTTLLMFLASHPEWFEPELVDLLIQTDDDTREPTQTRMVDMRDEQGLTALMLASKYGNERLFNHLLARGADPNVHGPHDYESVLLLVIEKGQRNLMRSLLQDPRTRVHQAGPRSALYTAICNGQSEILRDLLTLTRSYVGRVSTESEALYDTIRFRSFDMTRIFLECHDRYDLDSHGKRALNEAVETSAPYDIITALIDMGADYRMNVMSIAVKCGRKDVVKLLETKDEVFFTENDLVNAAKLDDKLELFLHIHPKIREPSHERIQRAILFAACDLSTPDNLDFLWKKGYIQNLALQDHELRTPLMVAARHDNLPIVKYLCENGPITQHDVVDVYQKNTLDHAISNSTILDYLLWTGKYGHVDKAELIVRAARYDESVRVLLAHGASRKQPFNGLTPLRACVMTDSYKTALLLLTCDDPEQAPDVHEVHIDRNLLQLAVQYQHCGTIKVLLEFGADPLLSPSPTQPNSLIMAIQGYSQEPLKTILLHNIDLVWAYRKTPDEIRQMDEQEVAEYIDKQLITVAVHGYNWSSVRTLVDAGADLFGLLDLINERGTPYVKGQFEHHMMQRIIQNYVFEFKRWRDESLQFMLKQEPPKSYNTRSVPKLYLREFDKEGPLSDDQYWTLNHVHYGPGKKPGILREIYDEYAADLGHHVRAADFTKLVKLMEDMSPESYPKFLQILEQRRQAESKRQLAEAGGSARPKKRGGSRPGGGGVEEAKGNYSWFD